MFYSAPGLKRTVHRHLPVFIKDIITHKLEQLWLSYFILKSKLMNNRRVTPLTFTLYWFHMHSKVAGHTFVHSFNVLPPAPFFFFLRGNYYTQTHIETFFFLRLFLSNNCSVCHRSEAKVNQIEYSCPLCVSFHCLPGLLSFPLGLQTALLRGLTWTLLYSHEYTHTYTNPGSLWGHCSEVYLFTGGLP